MSGANTRGGAALEQICTRCVMDTTDVEISFDDDGVCNHCRRYEQRMAALREQRTAESLDQLLDEIKSLGRGRDYDCIIGVSGGVDSSYLALLTKDWGLRPLAVHFDNGWDSELAVKNIHGLLEHLDIDLHTDVVDWEEFRGLQIAFFEASVIDIELPTDNAIRAVMYRAAARFGVRTVLSGNNESTEAVMPASWVHNKMDVRNIKGIHRVHGSVPLRTLPMISTLQFRRLALRNRIRAVNVLDRVDYDRGAAVSRLTEATGWRPYPSKHHESVFTRAYQSYILPTKFGVDKRKAHLSALINAGQVRRDEAIRELEDDPAATDAALADRRYVIKKLGVTEATFDGWMARPPRAHRDFPSEDRYVQPLLRLRQRLLR